MIDLFRTKRIARIEFSQYIVVFKKKKTEINFGVNFFPILMVGQKTISSNLEPICGCQPSIK
jgi:hypothetical protein